MFVRFEWDEAKNEANLLRHGLDFETASFIFEGPVLVAPDRRFDYGEDRFIVIGAIDEVEIVVVYTLRQDVCRIISARRARRDERRKYRAKVSH